MGGWLHVLAAAAFLGAVLYLLYSCGFASSKCIRAIVFVFLPGKNADQARVDSCTGWLRHVGRFRENRTYAFVLDMQLSGGEVEVVLLDAEKQPLLKLDRHSPVGRIRLDGESRYYLHWEFRGATGRCELRW